MNYKDINTYDYDLDESLIQTAIDSLKLSEPIRKEILKQSADMIGGKEIARKLSRAVGNEELIENEIKSLTKMLSLIY